MGKLFKKKSGQQSSAPAAVELFPQGVPSKAYQDGRLLVLKFKLTQKPALNLIEFTASKTSKTQYRQRGLLDNKTNRFKNGPVAKALPIFFLDYLCACLDSPPRAFHMEGGNGTPAASLGNALYDRDGSWFRLFVDYQPNGEKIYLVETIFSGGNWDGRQPEPRMIELNSEELPADCIEVYWNGEKLTGLVQIQKLTDRFRTAWELPPPAKLDLPKGEAPVQQELLPDTPPANLLREKPSANPALPEDTHKFSNWLSQVVDQTLDILQARTRSAPKAPEPNPSEAQVGKASARTISPNPETPTTKVAEAAKAADEPEPQEPILPEVPQSPIDPRLFTVWPPENDWDIDMPLVHFADESICPPWTLQNAFEGVLVLGATGSGKSSGSGNVIAEAFLRSGFGGLVLTVKRDEAEHWRKLCAHCGRENDFISVTRGGEWKLNILAYEAQRPGRGQGLSANLVALCNNLLNISARNQGTGLNESYWQRANNQILEATFEMFLLSGAQLTFDRLADFVTSAPTEKLPDTEAAWLKIPCFGQILAMAQKNSQSPEDLRLLKKSKDYWFKIYATLNSKQRTSLTLGVFSMLDAFRSRDIPALIAAETNFTPESIMSGKIVVLDLPLKELDHTGLVVQSALKYLFQTALERQGSANDPNRRPVFIWEDEAQYFASDHDSKFQDTARSSRVSRVLLSQNLNSFYNELGQGGMSAANSIFGNLNTKIFHANSDPATNEWAAKHFGQEIQFRVSVGSQPPRERPQSADFADSILQAFHPPSTGGNVSATEHWEYAVRPEEFNRLRTGGRRNDWLVDAYVTWIGLTGQNDRHFAPVTFNQNPAL